MGSAIAAQRRTNPTLTAVVERSGRTLGKQRSALRRQNTALPLSPRSPHSPSPPFMATAWSSPRTPPVEGSEGANQENPSGRDPRSALISSFTQRFGLTWSWPFASSSSRRTAMVPSGESRVFPRPSPRHTASNQSKAGARTGVDLGDGDGEHGQDQSHLRREETMGIELGSEAAPRPSAITTAMRKKRYSCPSLTVPSV